MQDISLFSESPWINVMSFFHFSLTANFVISFLAGSEQIVEIINSTVFCFTLFYLYKGFKKVEKKGGKFASATHVTTVL